MPRAFLITHRRYNVTPDAEQREPSPEHKVSVGEGPMMAAASYCGDSEPDDGPYTTDGSSSVDCPDDLYNLTKLAEVSLAAAAGQLHHHRHLALPGLAPPLVSDTSDDADDVCTTYTHKLFDRSIRAQRNQSQVSRAESGAGCPEEAHECLDCGKRYSTSSNLARHRQTHRSLADKKARRCPHCGKVYVSMPAFSMHVRTHTQGCRCHYCGKCFSRPWLLQGHIRTHTGEKPYKCTVCQKAFADKSNLRAHVQTHSSTKPHVCARCGKAFALKSYLYKHEESSCMRGQRHAEPPPPAALPHQVPAVSAVSAPTPVIRPPLRRTTVISPNPERALQSRVHKPLAPLSAGRYCAPADQPVDFSTRDAPPPACYPVGLAITV